MHEAIINKGKMNDQECIIKKYLTSCSVDKYLLTKALQM